MVLRVGLRLHLARQGKTVGAHLVQELREVRGRQEHAGEVGETGVLLKEGTVLQTQFVGFVGLGGNLALELTNVF